MKSKKRLIQRKQFLPAVGLLLVLACGGREEDRTPTGSRLSASRTDAAVAIPPGLDSVPYSNDYYRFAINFPRGWTVKGSMIKNTVVKAAANQPEKGIALLSVAAIDLAEEMRKAGVSDVDPDELRRLDVWDLNPADFVPGIADASGEFPGAAVELLESRKVTLNGRHALFVRSRSTTALFSSSDIVYFLQKRAILFRVRGSTSGDDNWFLENESTFVKSIGTLRLRD